MTRLTNFRLLVLLSLLFIGCGTEQGPDGTARPNLILIIADDMAREDCGAYGHPHLRTPNIDRLAAEGMLFNQAFLTTSSCSPSRASIITGTYPHQTDAEQLHWPLPADRMTFVEHLKASGYWTAAAGKWHLGDAVRDRFDWVAAESTAGFVLQSKGAAAEESAAENDGSGCQQWLPTLQKRPDDRPFFLWLAAVDPHRPYEANIIEQPHQPQDVVLPPYLPDTDAVRRDFALYYDEIHRMDAYIGQVLEELDRAGIADNTLILFIADNGRAFPREKTTLYDGGIRTPWIVRWPQRVTPGSRTDALVSSLDIAPTFLRLAGLPVDPGFEGRDFGPVLEDPGAEVNEMVYAEDHWHDFEDYSRAVRSRKFKYIRNFYPDLPNTPPADALRSPTFATMLEWRSAGRLNDYQMACFTTPRAPEELYEVDQDPFELHNLAADPDYSEVLADMRAAMAAIRARTKDKLPANRTPDEFTRDGGQPLPNRIRPRPAKAEMFPDER